LLNYTIYQLKFVVLRRPFHFCFITIRNHSLVTAMPDFSYSHEEKNNYNKFLCFKLMDLVLLKKTSMMSLFMLMTC